MADLSHPYGAYARLQQRSSGKTQLDDEYWGIEAALDALLGSLAASATPEDIERVVSSAARKERHRARLRAVHLAVPDGDAHDDAAQYKAIEAVNMATVLRQHVANDDWHAFEAIAVGEPYDKVAHELGVSAGTLRVRVSRVRKMLVALAA